MDSLNPHTSSAASESLRFRCPGCQQVLQVPPKYAGCKVKCSQCAQLLQVPGIPAQRSESLRPKNFVICICGNCKHIFKSPQQSAGNLVMCPNCKESVEIPSQTGRISDSNTLRFLCGSCQQDYCVLSKYGGKKFTCLVCKHSIAIPIPAPVQEQVSPEILDEPEVLEDEPSPYQLQPEPQDESVPAYQEFDISRVQQQSPSRTKRKRGTSDGTSAMSKLKLPLIAIGGVVGFIIGFIVVTSLFKGGSQSQPEIPFQSPEAIAFAEDNIQLLVAMKPQDVQHRFHDQVPVDASDIRELTYSVGLGKIDHITSEVTFSKVGEGASGYIVESVITYAGQFTRTIQAGICTGIQDVYEGDYWIGTEEFSKLMSLRVMDADGLELYAIGETTDYLITQLNDFVTNNELVSFGDMNKDLLLTILIVVLFMGLITLISQISIFVRAGEPGWAVFIPIYREICMARIAEKPEILGVICGIALFVPSIGQLAYLILFCMFSIGIARAFDKGFLFGLGLAFLPVIFYPILAFSGRAYD